MKKKKEELKYKCIFCEKPYKTEKEADNCFTLHNTLFVPMTAEEVNQLMIYIYDQKQQNPPIAFINRLKKIMRKRAGKTH